MAAIKQNTDAYPRFEYRFMFESFFFIFLVQIDKINRRQYQRRASAVSYSIALCYYNARNEKRANANE